MTETKTVDSNMIDGWTGDASDSVALVLKQQLLPVDGERGVIFPPTYANIGYSIDELSDGTKVAQIDSIGSQANRMEPLFKAEKFKNLVPQIEFVLGKDEDGKERRVSLLDLAHRAGDAVVRSSALAVDIDAAFRKLLRDADAEPLAKIAPTSLVFGAWDSRGTQAKRPRIVRSFIRAENVEVLHGAAQYNSVWKMLGEAEKDELRAEEKKPKRKALSDVGFKDVPAVFRKKNSTDRVLGGVIANGPIYRQTTINLLALRSLSGSDDKSTEKLRRYLLGLALTAATMDMELYLREGCLLRYADSDTESWEVIPRRAKSTFVELTSAIALKYAQNAAKSFEIETKPEPYAFDMKKAKNLLAKKEEDEEETAG